MPIRSSGNYEVLKGVRRVRPEHIATAVAASTKIIPKKYQVAALVAAGIGLIAAAKLLEKKGKVSSKKKNKKSKR